MNERKKEWRNENTHTHKRINQNDLDIEKVWESTLFLAVWIRDKRDDDDDDEVPESVYVYCVLLDTILYCMLSMISKSNTISQGFCPAFAMCSVYHCIPFTGQSMEINFSILRMFLFLMFVGYILVLVLRYCRFFFVLLLVLPLLFFVFTHFSVVFFFRLLAHFFYFFRSLFSVLPYFPCALALSRSHFPLVCFIIKSITSLLFIFSSILLKSFHFIFYFFFFCFHSILRIYSIIYYF